MFAEFCNDNNHAFPPCIERRSAVIADFLCDKAERSERPESTLTAIMAALGHFFQTLDSNPLPVWLHNLKHALIKACSTKAKGRTPIMPTDTLNNLFESWADNELLSIKRLRQKCVSLLALCGMCRPSDLIRFKRNDITFNEDKSVTIVYFGIKNDKNRKGFEIRLRPASNAKLDPVACLKSYLGVTKALVADDGPTFLSLIPPHDGLSVASISDILRETIKGAGLSDKKFTPRAFRPTGASASIKAGNDPEVTRQIGRWRSRDVFYESYVYPLAHDSFTDNLLNTGTFSV